MAIGSQSAEAIKLAIGSAAPLHERARGRHPRPRPALGPAAQAPARQRGGPQRDRLAAGGHHGFDPRDARGDAARARRRHRPPRDPARRRRVAAARLRRARRGRDPHEGLPRRLAADVRRGRSGPLARGARHARAPGRRRAAALRWRSRSTPAGWSSPSTSSPSRSTTPPRTASGSPSSPARSPSPRAARSRSSSSSRAARAPRRRARPATRAARAGWRPRSGTSASSCSTSAGPAARPRSGRSRASTRRRRPTYLAHFRADAIVRDCRAHPPRARRRALERPRAELRRAVRHDVPVARAGGPARGAHHRRAAAARAPGRRRLRAHLARGCSSATGATTTRYPGDRERVRDARRALEREPAAAAVGRPADRAAGCASSAAGSG